MSKKQGAAERSHPASPKGVNVTRCKQDWILGRGWRGVLTEERQREVSSLSV